MCDVTHLGKVAEARLFQEVRAGKSRRGPEKQMVPGEKESQFDFVEGLQVASLINKGSKLQWRGNSLGAVCRFFFWLPTKPSAAATFLQTVAMSELKHELYIMSMSSRVATNDASMLEAVEGWKVATVDRTRWFRVFNGQSCMKQDRATIRSG